MRDRKTLVLALSAALALALALAACGGGSSSTSGGTTSESTGTATGEGSTTEDVSSGAASKEAKALLAPYIGHPSPFPVTEKLKEVPKGATIAYMDCGTPVCALFWQLIGPAAQTMGVTIEHVKAGAAANTVSAAFDSVVAKKPDAVISVGIDIELWQKQLKELDEMGIPVVTSGSTEAEQYEGITGVQAADSQAKVWSELLAAYIADEMSEEANVAFYYVPELPFERIMSEEFPQDLEAMCPGCTSHASPIQLTTIGNTAPNTIVSDLQANPETTIAVFAGDEIETGLPAALQSAGIEVETLGNIPTPTNLQYVKEGKETATLGYDVPVWSWMMLDMAAKGIVGQELTGPEGEGLVDLQFLTQKDIKFDPTKGWTGYPDFAERFAKLWGVGG